MESGGTINPMNSCVEGRATWDENSHHNSDGTKFAYVRMEKVLLIRDVITPPFFVEREAGQQTAGNH